MNAASTSNLLRDPATRLPVPAVTMWSAETSTPARLVVRRDPRGLAYTDERPNDRAHGALWDRVLHAQGQGRARFRLLHPERQRRAAVEQLCQVCYGPASRTPDGTLFVLPDEPGAGEADSLTLHPPVCVPHARLAASACPTLRRRHVAVRVLRCSPWGMFGTHYHPGPLGPEPNEELHLPFGDPELPWLLAAQIVLRLRRTRVVDLDREERTGVPPHTDSAGKP